MPSDNGREVATEYRLTLAEMSRCCDVAAEHILLLVGEGVLDPLGHDPRELRFDIDDLVRAQQALRMQRDLGVNCAGAALAIELIEEAERLRERVRVLERLAFRS